ncbi:MAG: hypothetical protein GQ557_00955 [Mycoplasmataceae bacterium]|nr:hypothetical protein [Mycoplasmataceae bacterium]
MSRLTYKKIITIFLIFILIISCIFSIMLTLSYKKSTAIIFMPQVNNNFLSMSIDGYNGEIDQSEFIERFMINFLYSIESNLVDVRDLNFSFAFSDLEINVKTEINNQEFNFNFVEKQN